MALVRRDEPASGKLSPNGSFNALYNVPWISLKLCMTFFSGQPGPEAR